MQIESTQVIEVLQKEAKADTVIKDAFYMCATRPRNRYHVTADALRQRMVSQGFKGYDIKAARNFLSLLAKLGFGRLQKNSKGRVVALTEIKTKLQDIGKAALGETTHLDSFNKRNRFEGLQAVPKAPVKPTAAAPKPLLRPANTPVRHSMVGLAVNLGGRMVNLPVDSLSAEEIGLIAARFREPKRA